ncbi:glycosyltransferase [Maribacter spongiicola]|uniref:glycosyltransferase n=1 Tax=Maribacter spongiicola TaxID=1206753 RepID=UPI003F9782AE
MLKILINAYACSPHTGSEPGMAWNWCINLAKHAELHIITEGEFKQHIEIALLKLPQRNNMHFYYNEISPEIRIMCWNQGDWRFYKHYKKWQLKTFEIALKITKKENIDIIHQLNMIGFREPGYLWKIPNKPFIWGPIGGLKQFPTNYLSEVDLKTNILIRLKNSMNILQLQYDKRVDKALNHANLLISSIPDSYSAIKKYKGLESVVIPETGCLPSEPSSQRQFKTDFLNVIWVGKFDFRKQLLLALKSIAATENKAIFLHIYGEGNKGEKIQAENLALDLGIKDQIIWYGNQTLQVVQEAMKKGQLFFFTSVSEDTSTVILEAVSNNLPVLCFDTCGMGAVIDETVGRKIPLSRPKQSIVNFAKYLNYFHKNRDVLTNLSNNCNKQQLKFSWEEKAKTMISYYQKSIENRN